MEASNNTSKQGRSTIPLEATAQTVAQNLRRLRNARGLSVYALSAALKAMGRSTSPDAISKMENAARPEARHVRRVDVDDLVALAVALGVSPSALLLPPTDSPGGTVEVTAAGKVSADDAWDWADGKRPLLVTDRYQTPASDERLMFALLSRPPIRRGQENGHG